ncbi:MAG: hypothetical protein ACI9MC_000595 [Kiritimatiellia bacterium]|jgi:hypothetical protein
MSPRNPERTVVGFSTDDGEVVHADAESWQRFVRQVGRRARVVDAEDWSDLSDIDVLIIGAPRERVGPERVQELRRWVRRGGRALVMGTSGGDHQGELEPQSDHGLILRGLLLPDVDVEETIDAGAAFGQPLRLNWRGGAYVLTPRSALEGGKDGRAGSLWPRGRGWFRMPGALDVQRVVQLSNKAVRDKKAWGLVSLSLRRGLLVGLAGAEVLDDVALADDDHVRFAADLLDHVLPAPEAWVFARGLDHGGPAPVHDPRLERVLDELLDGGLRPEAYQADFGQHPVEHFAGAFRLLGTKKLARFKGGRVVLTNLGREHKVLVRHVLTWRHGVLAADLADDDLVDR